MVMVAPGAVITVKCVRIYIPLCALLIYVELESLTRESHINNEEVIDE